MAATDREAPHHNKLTCVKHYQCKLPECVERYRAYQRDRYHGRVAGTWQPLEDAEPVRQHILTLHAAGFTNVRISELTRLPFETVIGFTRTYGNSGYRKARKRRCTREVAARILALDPATAKPGITDATGTRRRLQALVAAGWPMEHLGPRISLSCRTVRALIRQERVYGRTAEAVVQLFDELKNARPERRGVTRASAARSRTYAKARNWPTIGYWATRMDVIDDPDFVPEYGLTRAEVIAQEAQWLMKEGGLDRAGAAERLGVHKSYVDQALSAQARGELGVAA